MKNDAPLKWKLKLTVELAPGESVERDVAEWKRGAEVDLASLGLSTEEGKNILSEVQTHVKLQVERHGEAHRCCDKCGRKRRKKGHYRSTFRSLYGNVPVQVRRVKSCRAAERSAYRGHRFPKEIISYCVWFYFRFSVSFRDVEEAMAARGCIGQLRNGPALVREVRQAICPRAAEASCSDR